MVVSGDANFCLTTFEGDHGMSSRILGGLRPFLATSGAAGGECGLGGTFRVVPFMVGRLDVGMTIYLRGIRRCTWSGGSGGSVRYNEVDNRSRCDRHQVGGPR